MLLPPPCCRQFILLTGSVPLLLVGGRIKRSLG